MQRYNCSESEPWCCCWSLTDASIFFVGTKRGQIFEYDTRSADALPKRQLEFPDKLPIIGMCHVPKVERRGGGRAPSCPSGGILVQTLNSIWFLEEVVASDDEQREYKPHKLAIDGPFWSIRCATVD